MRHCKYFGFMIFFHGIICEQVSKSVNGTVTNRTESHSEIQPMSRSAPEGSSNSSQKGKSEFKPSPQLETYYEFNKNPVPPVLPEAKHFYNLGESPVSWSNADQTWRPKIKFPEATTSRPTSIDHPYPFYNSHKGSTGKSYGPPSGTSTLERIPTVDEWGDYEKMQPQFDFNARVPAEKPIYGGQKTSFEYDAIEKPLTQMQSNPWKKIVKFLAALVPIGLLISALTPTVITVQSVNGTSRSLRKLDRPESANDRLVSSLLYFNSVGCEDRILCELVLGASLTQNAEEHVENLLNTFTKEGKAVEKAEEMRRIFEAVKKQDCRSIVCKKMEKK